MDKKMAKKPIGKRNGMTSKQFKAPKSIKFLGYRMTIMDVWGDQFSYECSPIKDCTMTVSVRKSRKWRAEVEVVRGKGDEATPYYLAFASGSTFQEVLRNARKDALEYVKHLLRLVTHDPRPSLNKHLYGH